MIYRKSNIEDRTEQEVAQRLVDCGLLDEIPRPMSDEEDVDTELIVVQAEALSDMIIRERR